MALLQIEVNGKPQSIDVPDDATPQEIDELVNSEFPQAPQKGLLGETSIGIPKVPEWKQHVMGQVNQLDKTGGAVGGAAGMAASIPFGGTQSPWMIPTGAGIGAMAGEALKTPLTQLLLPEAGAQVPSPGKLAKTALSGAEQGMFDASAAVAGPAVVKAAEHYTKGLPAGTAAIEEIPGRIWQATKDAGKKTARTLEEPFTTLENRVARYMARRNLRPQATGRPKSPEINKRAVETYLDKNIRVSDIDQGRGPEKVQQLMVKPKSHVDKLTSDYAEVPLARREVLRPAEHSRRQFSEGDRPSDVEAIDKYVEGVKELHPDPNMTIGESQKMKTGMYKTIPSEDWTHHTGDPIKETRKGISRNIPDLQVEALGGVDTPAGLELERANQELGDLLQLRPFVNRASERVENAPWRQRATARANDTIGQFLYKRAKIKDSPVWKTDDRQLELTGSPVEQLERLFGTKYGNATEFGDSTSMTPTPGQKQLPAPYGERSPSPTADYYPTTQGPAQLPGPQRKQLPAPDAEGWDRVAEGSRRMPPKPQFGPEAPTMPIAGKRPTEVYPQLPAPIFQGTPSEAVLNNEDIKKLIDLGNISPQDIHTLKTLLMMK